MKRLTRDKYLTQDEFRRLIREARERRHVNAKRDTAFLLTSGLAGLRAGEAIGLRVGDFHEERGSNETILSVVAEKKRDRGPTLPLYDVGLPRSAARALREYLRTLPPERRKPWSRIFPITRQQARRIFKFYADRAGLNPRYTLHALRHFRGVQVYQETLDVKLCQRALRHSHLQATEAYVHVVDATQKMASVDPFEEEAA